MKDRTDEFKAFVESKPRDEQYNRFDAHECALGQFGIKAAGRYSAEAQGIPQKVFDAAVNQPPFTFGALADRLKELSS